MSNIQKNALAISAVLALCTMLIAGYASYVKFWHLVPGETQVIEHESRCLGENEYVTYQVSGQTGHSTGTIEIAVKDKITEATTTTFTQRLFQPGHYHPAELMPCHAYFIQGINHDPTKLKQDLGFRAEIWKYDYAGVGEFILLLSEVSDEGFYGEFSYDFRISPNEQYITLIRGYGGRDDYAIVMKDIETKEDILTLSYADLIAQHPTIGGSFGLREWQEDADLFIADVFDGTREYAYLFIDPDSGSYEVLETPQNLPYGAERRVNFAKGYLAYADLTTWTGMEGDAEWIAENAAVQGLQKHLYLTNLRTQETAELLAIDPRAGSFELKWTDDSTLQYTNPETGERVEYVVEGE